MKQTILGTSASSGFWTPDRKKLHKKGFQVIGTRLDPGMAIMTEWCPTAILMF